jgi:hypothetical protein
MGLEQQPHIDSIDLLGDDSAFKRGNPFNNKKIGRGDPPTADDPFSQKKLVGARRFELPTP